MNYKNQISDYIDSHCDEMIQLLSELVSIKSVMSSPQKNAPFGAENARALEFVLERCREYGFSTENVDNFIGSASLNSSKPELAVLCHLDVVPEGCGWSFNPFELYHSKSDGRLYGRGTSDDKGPAVATIFATKAVCELNIPLAKGAEIIFGTNEENGSADLKHYLEKKKMPSMVFTPDGSYPVINIEKGMIRINLSSDFNDGCGKILNLSGGDVINAVPGTAFAELADFSTSDVEKLDTSRFSGVSFRFAQNGSVLCIEADGKSAHASTPDSGCNAVTALLGLLSEFNLPDCSQTRTIKALAKLYPFGESNGKSCGIQCHDEKSGALSIVLSIINLDSNGFSAKNDIRFPLCTSSKNIVENLSAVLNTSSIKTDVIMSQEPHCTDENSSFVQTLLGVYEDITGDKGECIAIGGGTYVHEIDGGVAFGAEFPNETCNMHGADEFITVDNLLKNAKIMANAIVALCK